MTVQVIEGFDITSSNFGNRPSQAGLIPAFYSTGSPDIRLTSLMDSQHPDALHIDQANGHDDTADYADCERGCYTPAQIPGRIQAMRAAYAAKRRKFQRWPGVYVSRKAEGYSVTDVVNALSAAGITNVPLIIADWNDDVAQAMFEVANSSGPYPVVGRQFKNAGPYDLNIFSFPWVTTTAGGTIQTGGTTVNVSVTLAVLREGATGDAVRTLQGLCIARGHNLTVDGNFGSQTLSAVKAVQSQAKIADDGVVGHDTWTKLLTL